MSLTRGLTEIDGAFASVSALQASKPVLDSVVSVSNGNQYKVSLNSSGTSLLLANGYYAVQISSNYTNDDRNLAKTTTKGEFEALQNANKAKYAGSGIVETGKSYTGGGYKSVNDGIWCPIVGNTLESNKFFIGTNNSISTTKSKTGYPIFNVSGVIHDLNQTAPLGIALNSILLPPASDGTETYNTATGVYVQHASSAIAFASETATNKVITERSDLVVMKIVKAVDLSSNPAFPLGNMQYGASSYEGVSLQNNNTPQSLSAFGSWDSVTTGYSAVLNDTNTASFVQKAENNIYSDDAILKQDQYKILSHKGMYNYASGDEAMTAFGYTRVEDDANLWTDGTDFFLFITLVSRLNQGLKHKEFNDNGTKKASDNNFWYNTGIAFTSKADCFDPSKLLTNSGSIASNLSGRSSNDSYQFYDAIYAGLFEDLRISARRQDYSRLLEDSVRKDIAGATRGKGKVPFTKVFSSVGAVTSDYTIINQDNASAVVAQKELPTVYNEIPMAAIGGNPSDIMATFPNGVAASWLGLLDGTNKELIGKANATTANQVSTSNNGTSWASSTASIDNVANKVTTTLTSGSVVLFSYPVLSNTTEAANNSKVLGGVGDVVGNSSHHTDRGNRLCGSLINSVLVGNFVESQTQYVKTKSFRMYGTSNTIEAFDNIPPEHQILNLLDGGLAFKTLYTITEKDGLLYIQYHGRELKYNGSWGDDSTIPIGNGNYTVTDDNGQTVKAFCHHSLIPLGIAHYE